MITSTILSTLVMIGSLRHDYTILHTPIDFLYPCQNYSNDEVKSGIKRKEKDQKQMLVQTTNKKMDNDSVGAFHYTHHKWRVLSSPLRNKKPFLPLFASSFLIYLFFSPQILSGYPTPPLCFFPLFSTSPHH